MVSHGHQRFNDKVAAALHHDGAYSGCATCQGSPAVYGENRALRDSQGGGPPLGSFSARPYLACYVEWWFGDRALSLDRQRPMLYEQKARWLINIEHQYALPSDTEPYKASSQSRVNNPEIIAVRPWRAESPVDGGAPRATGRSFGITRDAPHGAPCTRTPCPPGRCCSAWPKPAVLLSLR